MRSRGHSQRETAKCWGASPSTINREVRRHRSVHDGAYVVIKKLMARTKEQASAAMARTIIGLKGRIKTITLDNGTEFHDYKSVEDQFRVKFFFTTPYHSWERGANENTNGLIRQYLPKGMCLKNLTQAQCNWIANELNNRPRERLGFRTPAEVFRRPRGVALQS